MDQKTENEEITVKPRPLKNSFSLDPLHAESPARDNEQKDEPEQKQARRKSNRPRPPPPPPPQLAVVPPRMGTGLLPLQNSTKDPVPFALENVQDDDLISKWFGE